MANAYRRNKVAGGDTRRQSDEVKAARAETLLANPDFRAAFEGVRAQIVLDLEATSLDGSPEVERRVLEYVRQLQALLEVKAKLMEPLTAALLKAGRVRSE